MPEKNALEVVSARNPLWVKILFYFLGVYTVTNFIIMSMNGIETEDYTLASNAHYLYGHLMIFYFSSYATISSIFNNADIEEMLFNRAQKS